METQEKRYIYFCKVCGEEWEIEGCEKVNVPEKCPLCNMPLHEMVKECWEVGGFREVLLHLIKRLIKEKN